MVYSRDLKSLVERHAGSSPASRTKNLVCSYRGYYCGLSIHLRGFDSPTDRQILASVDNHVDWRYTRV